MRMILLACHQSIKQLKVLRLRKNFEADKAQTVAALCSPQGDCIYFTTKQGHLEGHGFLFNPPPQDLEGDSAWLQLCASTWLCGCDCKVAVLGIFQVFSISISDEAAREEVVVCSMF